MKPNMSSRVQLEVLEQRTFLSSPIVADVLPDGSNLATLQRAGIVTPQAPNLAADPEFDLCCLNGDANRDGQVTLRDLDIVAANFGRSGTDWAHGDFTYDGTTDLKDLNILAAQFGTVLPPRSLGNSESREAPFDGNSIDPDGSFVMGSDYVRVTGGGGPAGLYRAQRYNAAGVPQGSSLRIGVPTEGRLYTAEYTELVIAGAANRDVVTWRIWNEMLGRLIPDTAAPEARRDAGPDQAPDLFEATDLSHSPADDELLPVWELESPNFAV